MVGALWAGFLVSSALACSLYGPLLWLFPLLVAFLMTLVGRGRPVALGVAFGGAVLFSGSFLQPVDPAAFLVQDVLNHQVVNARIAAFRFSPLFWSAVPAAALAGVLLGWFAGADDARRRVGILALLAVVLVNTALLSAFHNPGFFSAMQAPSGGLVGNDNSGYKAIYFRMAAGQAFYPAHIESFVFNREFGAPNYVLGYRMPGLFQAWKYLTGGRGMGVQYLFVTLAIAGLCALYRAGLRFLDPAEAVVAPVLVAPLLAYGIPGWHQLMMEYWSLFMMLVALPFFAGGSGAGATVPMTLAVLFRITMLVPAGWMFLGGLASTGLRSRWLTVLPAMAGLTSLAAHAWILLTGYPEFVTRMAVDYPGEGVLFLRKAFDFGGVFYGHWHWLVGLAGAGAAVALLRIPRGLAVWLGGTLLTFLVFYFLRGHGFRTYWGILTSPLVLILAAWSLAWLAPPPDPAPPRPSGS